MQIHRGPPAALSRRRDAVSQKSGSVSCEGIFMARMPRIIAPPNPFFGAPPFFAARPPPESVAAAGTRRPSRFGRAAEELFLARLGE